MPHIKYVCGRLYSKKGGTVVTHMFEKLLKLKDLMLTDSEKKWR